MVWRGINMADQKKCHNEQRVNNHADSGNTSSSELMKKHKKSGVHGRCVVVTKWSRHRPYGNE